MPPGSIGSVPRGRWRLQRNHATHQHHTLPRQRHPTEPCPKFAHTDTSTVAEVATAARYGVVAVPRSPTRAELIAALWALADSPDDAPTREEVNSGGRFSAQPYYTEFGSWNAALEAAGFNLNHRNGIPDGELEEEMRRLADEKGRAPTFEEMAEDGEFSPYPYIRRWGTWLKAREACGLSGEKHQFGKRADPDDLLAELRRLEKRFGRPPTQTEVSEFADFEPITYHRHFGSFTDALELAGFDLADDRREWPGGYASQSAWDDLRGRVRRRDGKECVVCGMTEQAHQDEYEETLHVHHLEGAGPLDADNCVTLCQPCHSKWDRVGEDPRELTVLPSD